MCIYMYGSCLFINTENKNQKPHLAKTAKETEFPINALCGVLARSRTHATEQWKRLKQQSCNKIDVSIY